MFPLLLQLKKYGLCRRQSWEGGSEVRREGGRDRERKSETDAGRAVVDRKSRAAHARWQRTVVTLGAKVGANVSNDFVDDAPVAKAERV